MKKVGLCIKYYHENYGGMLQAFATTKLLDKMKVDYEIIRYKKKINLMYILKSIPRFFNNVLLNDKYESFQKKISFKKHPEFKKNDATRMKAFDDFRTEKFSSKLSQLYVGFEKLKNGSKNYDAIITGSDQLWSPAGLPTNFYNLMFVDENVKKISYASSFGVKNIPWYQIKRTRKFLSRLDYISMRENRGADIVKELTGKDVPVVLDPVFLFDNNEWEKLVPNKKMLNEKYIFAYFLGANTEYRKEVVNFAKENKLKIVTLRHLDQYVEFDEKFGDFAPYDVRPDDFLNYLRNAEYVFTDSFHGTVFSIIAHKKFMVFNRYSEKSKHSKNSRIDTLCKNFNLESRRFNKNIDMVKTEIDYVKVDKIYNKLKEDSFFYIKKSLDL